MKYIKKFEKSKFPELKRGDIIVMNYGSNSESLNLILKNTNIPDKYIEAILIGTLSTNFSHKKYISLVYNRNYNNIFTKSHNNYRFLSNEEKILFYDALTNHTYSIYIDDIKKKTGIDLKELEKEGYKEYLINKDANKYNL